MTTDKRNDPAEELSRTPFSWEPTPKDRSICCRWYVSIQECAEPLCRGCCQCAGSPYREPVPTFVHRPHKNPDKPNGNSSFGFAATLWHYHHSHLRCIEHERREKKAKRTIAKPFRKYSRKGCHEYKTKIYFVGTFFNVSVK